MFIDLTLKITPQMAAADPSHGNKALVGHLGTHFDVMNKEFPWYISAGKPLFSM